MCYSEKSQKLIVQLMIEFIFSNKLTFFLRPNFPSSHSNLVNCPFLCGSKRILYSFHTHTIYQPTSSPPAAQPLRPASSPIPSLGHPSHPPTLLATATHQPAATPNPQQASLSIPPPPPHPVPKRRKPPQKRKRVTSSPSVLTLRGELRAGSWLAGRR